MALVCHKVWKKKLTESPVSEETTLPFHLCHWAQESHFASWQHKRKKCWEGGKTMAQTVYKFVFKPRDMCIKTLLVLKLTRLWPLKRKYWIPYALLALSLPFFALFSLSVLSFPLWFFSCGKSLRALVTIDTKGKKTVRKPTSLHQIINIWWAVPPWIYHSLPLWACDVQKARIQKDLIQHQDHCDHGASVWPQHFFLRVFISRPESNVLWALQHWACYRH